MDSIKRRGNRTNDRKQSGGCSVDFHYRKNNHKKWQSSQAATEWITTFRRKITRSGKQSNGNRVDYNYLKIICMKWQSSQVATEWITTI